MLTKPNSQHVDYQLKQLLSMILGLGRFKGDRTGTGTYSIFGHQMRFDLSKGFPLATGKKIFTKGLIHELLWLISGSRDNGYLKSHDVHIWDDWDVVPKSWDDLCHQLLEIIDPDNSEKTLFHKFMTDPVEVDLLKQVSASGVNNPDFPDKLNADNYSKFIKSMEVYPQLSGQSLYDHLQMQRYSRLIEFCKEHKVNWSTGNLGPVYGEMWRSWPCVDGSTIDQLNNVVETLRTNPTSRRIIVSAWNPEFLPVEGRSHLENILDEKQVLPPCHTLFQFYAEELSTDERIAVLSLDQRNELTEMQNESKMEQWDPTEIQQFTVKWLNDRGVSKYRLSCQLYQRSADCGLGIFFNISSYALLTMMIAHVTNMIPGDFIHTLGDAHIYTNQVDQIRQYLDSDIYDLPTVRLNPAIKELTDFTFDDIFIEDYKSGPVIKTPVAV